MFDFWKLLAGLAIFLFGIYLMEESLKELAGKAFKKLIRKSTGTRFKAVLSGMISTSILQSSSAVSLMVLAFAGAGIISLVNAFGVIMGSNIGTTVTAWIIAVFGFKFSIESFALPMIGIGGVIFILSGRRPRVLNSALLLIAFGFIFHGLEFMKTSVEQVTPMLNLSAISGYGIGVFLLIGLALTALVQSSSATIAIVFTALNSQVIDFGAGAAMVVGANIGTTVTIMLGAAGGQPLKKRVAYSHFVFNLATGVVVILLFPVFTGLSRALMGGGNGGILAVALFHTLFNVTGVILFLPLISRFVLFMEKWIPKEEHIFTHYIQNTTTEVPEAAISAFKQEVLHLYGESRDYALNLFDLTSVYPLKHVRTVPVTSQKFYERIKELHAEIFEYYARVQTEKIEEDEAKELDLYLRAGRSFMNAVKNFKTIKSDLDEFDQTDNPFLNAQAGSFRDRLGRFLSDVDPVLEEMKPGMLEKRLKEIFDRVEQEDQQCINASSEAIHQGGLGELQVTSLLMVNRLFTQSLRMIVLSLENLLKDDSSLAARAPINGIE